MREPACFTLDPPLTSEALFVETSAEPLWTAVEHDAESRADVQRLAERLISSIALPTASWIDVPGVARAAAPAG